MEIVNPDYSLLRKNEKLQIIVSALMQRAEQSSEQSGYAYAQFERAALLEAQVRETPERAQALAVPGHVQTDLLAAAAIVPSPPTRIDDPTAVEGPFGRVAVFGGVYSNHLALAALLADAKRRGAEAVYCLGDLGGFGPNPEKVWP